jgi:hypothetical protein
VAGILLAVAIVLPLTPQMYSFDQPRLGGMPFFYWYQLVWVPISAALSGIAYLLVTGEDRRRRRAVRAESPGDDSPGSPGLSPSAPEGQDGGGRHVAPSSGAPTRTETTGETTGKATGETTAEGGEPR